MATSYPKEKIKVLLLEGVSSSAVDAFKQAGYQNVELRKGALLDDELIEALQDVHVLGIRSKTKLTQKVLEQAPKLLTAGCFCIGTNQVDLTTASSLGVPIFNSPFSNTRSVAELVIANAIFLIRRIPDKNKAAHDGVWLKDSNNSHEIRGKKLGIIGYGNIGSQVSVLAEGLGLDVSYYDVQGKLPLGNANQAQSLDQLLRESDIISLHVPGTPSTHNMIDAKALKQMKAGALLINASRGNVVDIDALKEAIESGHVSGAAVDVFPLEPKGKGAAFETPLQGLPNVILTPHIGGSTEEAQWNIGREVANKIIGFIENGDSEGSQSLPALNLPVKAGTHRILHVHQNVPGVMGAINQRLSEMQVNIHGQYLSTNDKVGYVVLDIDGSASADCLEVLRQVPNTIRARMVY